jgi:hypothetical protein
VDCLDRGPPAARLLRTTGKLLQTTTILDSKANTPVDDHLFREPGPL